MASKIWIRSNGFLYGLAGHALDRYRERVIDLGESDEVIAGNIQRSFEQVWKSHGCPKADLVVQCRFLSVAKRLPWVRFYEKDHGSELKETFFYVPAVVTKRKVVRIPTVLDSFMVKPERHRILVRTIDDFVI